MHFPLSSFWRRPALPAIAAACLLAACDNTAPPAPRPPENAPRPPVNVTITQPPETGRAPAATASGSLKQRQLEFLHRLRDNDPQARTIDRAIFNDQNELGLILDASVPPDKVSALLRTILIGMAREFPGQDLTVLAYSPSQPPRKLGTARLDARSREMTYTPER